MQVEQGGPVGEDRVDVDLLDVGEVGHGVIWQLQIANVLDGAVVARHLAKLGLVNRDTSCSFPRTFMYYTREKSSCDGKYFFLQSSHRSKTPKK